MKLKVLGLSYVDITAKILHDSCFLNSVSHEAVFWKYGSESKELIQIGGLLEDDSWKFD